MSKYNVMVRPSDGNAFSILSAVKRALKGLEREGVAPQGTAEEYFREATAGDYEDLIQVSLNYVDLKPS